MGRWCWRRWRAWCCSGSQAGHPVDAGADDVAGRGADVFAALNVRREGRRARAMSYFNGKNWSNSNVMQSGVSGNAGAVSSGDSFKCPVAPEVPSGRATYGMARRRAQCPGPLSANRDEASGQSRPGLAGVVIGGRPLVVVCPVDQLNHSSKLRRECARGVDRVFRAACVIKAENGTHRHRSRTFGADRADCHYPTVHLPSRPTGGRGFSASATHPTVASFARKIVVTIGPSCREPGCDRRHDRRPSLVARRREGHSGLSALRVGRSSRIAGSLRRPQNSDGRKWRLASDE